MQIIDLAIDGVTQQEHEAVDLAERAFPVLLAEDEEAQDLEPDRAGRLDRAPDSTHALIVTGSALQTPLLGPAAVPVHDDGHMGRQIIAGPELVSELLCLCSFARHDPACPGDRPAAGRRYANAPRLTGRDAFQDTTCPPALPPVAGRV